MIVIGVIWFFLPAYVANMAASLFKIGVLAKPISEKLFGSHKTWSGFVVGVILALLVAGIQKILFQFSFFEKISYLNYAENFLLIGFLLGFGALFGDLVKSFFKRRIGIAPGEKWIPFDQIDYTLGALLLSLFLWQPSFNFILISVIFNGIGHVFMNYLGFWLGIRKNPW